MLYLRWLWYMDYKGLHAFPSNITRDDPPITRDYPPSLLALQGRWHKHTLLYLRWLWYMASAEEPGLDSPLNAVGENVGDMSPSCGCRRRVSRAAHVWHTHDRAAAARLTRQRLEAKQAAQGAGSSPQLSLPPAECHNTHGQTHTHKRQGLREGP